MTIPTKEDKELFIAVSGSEHYAEDILMDNCFTWEVDAIAKYREQAALTERAAIVAFLGTKDNYDFDDLARDLQAGAHHHEK